TPLREGVAFMAVSAQRDLQKQQNDKAVWIVPTAIRYRYDDDVTPKLEQSVAEMEKRFMIAGDGRSLSDRIVRLGEVLLTIKQKEKLGQVQDDGSPLPQR